MNEKYNKIFPLKSNSDVNTFFGNSATGHFSGKYFSCYTTSVDTGSDDTGLETVAFSGAESTAVQTDRYR